LAFVILLVAFHYYARGIIAKRIAASLSETFGLVELNLRQAFFKSTGLFHSIFRAEPAGWGARAGKQLRTVRETVANHIQDLNDRYADPSGRSNAVITDQSQSAETTDVQAEPVK